MKTPSSRGLHSHAALSRLFSPSSVAIVGVSNRPDSFGGRTWANMSQFTGRLYAVNPGYAHYREQTCYPSLAALPEAPDCVILATSQDTVEDMVRQCADVGAGGAIVFASGYAETGREDRAQAQWRLGEIARTTGVRLLGPNCMGYVNNGSRACLTFVTEAPKFGPPSKHAIGIVSQSGAIGTSLQQASSGGMAFSHMLTAGNSVDVDIADQIAFLSQQSDCKAIACVFEGISNPDRLIEAGLMARRANKPVVVFKVARSDRGALAAASHTGALAGSDAAYAAAFDRGCMVLVEQFEHLLETASFLAKAAALDIAPPGVAVLSVSGGMAIMCADKASVHDIALPQPRSDVAAILKSQIPDFGSAQNPFDLTAQVVGLPNALGVCVDAVLASADYGAVVFPYPLAQQVWLGRLRTINELAAKAGKIACAPWMTQWSGGHGCEDVEAMSHTAPFRSLDACFRALKARTWWQSTSTERLDGPSSGKRAGAAGLLKDTQARHLTEGEAMRLLASYGVPVVADKLAGSARQAVAAAQALGFPVAMKVVSRDVQHKTEAGGVELGLHDAESVHDAYGRILERVLQAVPGAHIEGIVVQPMVPTGVELIIGSKQDPVFGPLIVVGLGGIFVELLRDVAVRMAPVDGQAALSMLHSLRGAPIFAGFRGAQPVDLAAVADVVVAVSQLAAEFADVIDEIDVNPLVCSAGKVVAVDALVKLRGAPEV